MNLFKLGLELQDKMSFCSEQCVVHPTQESNSVHFHLSLGKWWLQHPFSHLNFREGFLAPCAQPLLAVLIAIGFCILFEPATLVRVTSLLLWYSMQTISNLRRRGLFSSHFQIPEHYGVEIKVGIQVASHTTQSRAERNVTI